jgi:hypothetical protein
MVRRITPVLSLSTLLVVLAGCGAHKPPDAKSSAEAPLGGFPSEEKRMLACLDLRDHIVSLYADEYIDEQGLSMSGTERVAFHHGWAEELARKGTFERFEQTCFYGLTPHKYQCGMASTTTDGLSACMKLSER